MVKPNKSKKRFERNEDSDGETALDGEGEKKKRARYARAPLGSLANPDWNRMLGMDAE